MKRSLFPIPIFIGVVGLGLATLLFADSWTTKANMPTTRYGLRAAVVNNKLYAIGGYDGAATLGTNEEYDPVTNSWSTKANMPTVRLFLGVAAVGSKIYAIGGWVYDGNVLTANEEYDPSTNSWTTREPMPTARRSMGAAAVGSKIYVIGGWDGTTNFNNNDEYDPATDSWTVREPMIAARSGHVAVAANDMIYAVGGGTAGPGTANEEYDPESDLWTVMAPMPTARLAMGGAEAGGKVYIIGGTPGDGTPLAVNEEYDPVADSWTTRAPMPTARYQPAVAAVTTGKTAAIVKIYVIGGSTGQGFLNTNEEYTPGVGIEDVGIDVPICELTIAPTVSYRDFEISYGIKEPHSISVKVYDACGRLVCTLFDGLVSAGSYRRHWDASSVESGVYFCQLTVGNNSVTKKMIVMR